VKEIIKNQYYEIGFNKEINRMFVKVKGYWRNPDSVPNYVNDIHTIGSELSPGFTLIADLRDMKTPPLSLNPIHEAAQRTLIEKGLDRTAELLPEKDIVLKSVTQRIADESTMKKQTFSDESAAENWLAAS